MKHTLPIAIVAIAAAAAIAGVLAFHSGVFQTASVGELIRAATTPAYKPQIINQSSGGVNNPPGDGAMNDF